MIHYAHHQSPVISNQSPVSKLLVTSDWLLATKAAGGSVL